MTINYVQLRAFHAVASAGGFSKAARVLNVQQPTLSTQVGALEEGYGVRLFERRGRGVELTEFGRELLVITTRMFAAAAEADELLLNALDVVTGHLKLGASGSHLIVPMMAAFTRRHPGPRLSLMVDNSRALLSHLIDCRLDLAIVADAPDDPRFYIEPLRRDPVIAFVGPRHPWAGRRSVRLKELVNETIILRERGSVTRSLMEKAIAGAGLELTHIMEIDDWEAVRETAFAGLGVGIMSMGDLGTDRRMTTLVIKDADITITEHLVCLQERQRLRAVRVFYECARDIP